MSEPPNSERLPTDSDLSLAAFDAAMKILTPQAGLNGVVEVMLTFGPGCFYAAQEIDDSLRYTSGIMMTRHYRWQNYAEDEWSLTDRNGGRSVWCPGAGG